MKRHLVALLLLATPAMADEVLPHMISTRGVAQLLIGKAFRATARNGLVGIVIFGRNGHAAFKGQTNAKGRTSSDDIGVYRITETGYCSKWRSTGVTKCWMISPIVASHDYQVWTVYGQKADRFRAIGAGAVEAVPAKPLKVPAQPMKLTPPPKPPPPPQPPPAPPQPPQTPQPEADPR